MLSAGVKTLWCRVEWFQLLLLLCCPTSEIKGCCYNLQFTLILLPVDFMVFTYNCKIRFYQPSALFCSCEHHQWKPADTTHNLQNLVRQWHSCHSVQASPGTTQAGVWTAISIFTLVSCDAVAHGNTQQQWKSQEKQKFLSDFQWNDRGMKGIQWNDLACIQMPCPTLLASQVFPCFVMWDSWSWS